MLVACWNRRNTCQCAQPVQRDPRRPPARRRFGPLALLLQLGLRRPALVSCQVATDRLLVAVAALIVVPLALVMPALVTLAVLTVVCGVRTGWEAWRHPSIGPVRA